MSENWPDGREERRAGVWEEGAGCDAQVCTEGSDCPDSKLLFTSVMYWRSLCVFVLHLEGPMWELAAGSVGCSLAYWKHLLLAPMGCARSLIPKATRIIFPNSKVVHGCCPLGR